MRWFSRIRDRFSVFVVAFFAFVLYAITAYRGVGPTDSGELALAAWTGGVAHPPGFPLSTGLGWVWSHVVPWGSVAWRLNLFSAFAMAIAVGFVVAIARRWTMATGAQPRTASFAGMIAGTAFAVGPIAWSAAVVTEVYALNTLIVAAIVWVTTAYTPRGRPLVVAGLLAGAGLAVHPISTIFIAPVLLAWLWGGRAFVPYGADRQNDAHVFGLRIVVCGASAAAVLLIAYGWLLFRAQQHPVMNWGDPSTLERLWWHMSAAQYRVNLSTSFPRARELFGEGLGWWAAEFAWVGTVLGIAGWWTLRRVACGLAVSMVGVVLLTFAYTSAYDIAQDRESYFLPLMLLTACGVAPALAVFGGRARRWSPYASPAIIAIGAVMVLVLVPMRWAYVDRSQDTVSSDYARNALATAPRNALVIIADWQLYAPLWYLQEVEGFRRDVVLVDLLLWQNRPWYVDGITRRFPDLIASWQPSLDVFRRELATFERGALRDTATIASAYRALLSQMLITPDRAVLLDGLAASEIIRQQPSIPGTPVPYGLLLSVHRGPPPPTLPSIADWKMDALFASRKRQDPVAAIIRDQYIAALRTRAAYLMRAGDAAGAAEADALARDLRAP